MGGMARADGVVIASADHWAFAARDGSVREGSMPQPPEALRRVPLVRGLIRLFSALAPLFRGAGVAGRGERLLLVAALLAPLSLIVLPQSASLPLGIGTAVVLLGWMLRGRTLFLHGAEHRAIAAAEERRLVATWDAERQGPRASLLAAGRTSPRWWCRSRSCSTASGRWRPRSTRRLPSPCSRWR